MIISLEGQKLELKYKMGRKIKAGVKGEAS
jgi:hypothetical protein